MYLVEILVEKKHLSCKLMTTDQKQHLPSVLIRGLRKLIIGALLV